MDSIPRFGPTASRITRRPNPKGDVWQRSLTAVTIKTDDDQRRWDPDALSRAGGLQTFQNEMEVGTGRALSAVILVTWTATPGETARARAVVRIPVCADVNEPRSCYIPVCHRRPGLFLLFTFLLQYFSRTLTVPQGRRPVSDFSSARVQVSSFSHRPTPAACVSPREFFLAFYHFSSPYLPSHPR